MPLSLSISHLELPLTEPYVLSFGSVDTFETFIVRAELKGKIGYGEITPLPGYSTESKESTSDLIQVLGSHIDTTSDLDEFLSVWTLQAPMLVSGIQTAIDSLDFEHNQLFGADSKCYANCIGLCSGTNPETSSEKAKMLVKDGFKVLKLKIGGSHIFKDIDRVQAVASVTAGKAMLRIDANQLLSEEDAQAFLIAVNGLNIEYLEQPFKSNCDYKLFKLLQKTNVPLMMDESVWNADDIRRAANLGIPFVKLKLCKHRGLKVALANLSLAEQLGLNVVFGNGVQSGIGNRLELFLYKRANLTTAIESVGFNKINPKVELTGLSILNGNLIASSNLNPEILFEQGTTVSKIQIS